jgi:hypothetical protein
MTAGIGGRISPSRCGVMVVDGRDDPTETRFCFRRGRCCGLLSTNALDATDRADAMRWPRATTVLELRSIVRGKSFQTTVAMS